MLSSKSIHCLSTLSLFSSIELDRDRNVGHSHSQMNPKEVQPTIAANKKPSAGTNRGGERLKILDQISNNDPSHILEQ